jgi:hypothetical protein
MDLMYFGDESDGNSQSNQIEFINEVKELFPNVVLKNAYDSIKGFRQEVHLDDKDEDNFYSFVIGKGWIHSSLFMGITMRTKEKKEDFNRWFSLAKKRYPEAFKPEALI